MKGPEQRDNVETDRKIPVFLLSDLPPDFSSTLVADWVVDTNLDQGAQIARLVAKADNYLNGLNVPDGADKKQVRREAGRLLNYLRQTMENDELWQGVEPLKREHLTQEANRLWEELGNEANKEWNKSKADKPVVTQKDPEQSKSESEIHIEVLTSYFKKMSLLLSETTQLIDSRTELLRGSVPNFKDSSTDKALDLIKRMLGRAMPKFKDFQVELSGTDKSVESFEKAIKKYRGLVTGILPIVDGMRAIQMETRKGSDKAVATGCLALYEEFISKLGDAGIQRMKVEVGEKINYNTMMPSEAVGADDPTYGAKYTESETVADVEKDGFMFADNLEADRNRALVRAAQIIAYK